MWPSINSEYTQDKFRRRVADLSWAKWRPSKIVWHNTAAPTLAQWIKTADEDRAAGRIPGITRIRNLEAFFRDNNGWSGCPHLFIANDYIWEMNVLTSPGVHSPSWNSTSIGIEMIGDYDAEAADTGEGLKVKQNTVFATAILCEAIGLEPTSGTVDASHGTHGTIFLHKQDWKTTHDCPGKHMADDKAEMIAGVASLMSGGDAHDIGGVSGPPIAPKSGVATIDDLNVRRGPGVANEAIGSVPKGTKLSILANAANGADSWLQVRTPFGSTGWVSARYVQVGDI